MAQTLCPKCAFTPIAEGAEECPRCHEPFGFLPEHKKKRFGRSHLGDSERTDLGGAITSAVTAHPGPATAVLAAGAMIWFLRVGGVLGDPTDPDWVYCIVGVDLLVAALLWLNLGPAKVIAQLAAVTQAALALALSGGDLGARKHLFFTAHAVALGLLLFGEVGAVRRALGLSLGLAFAVLAAMSLGTSVRPRILKADEVVGSAFGYALFLPEGYVMSSAGAGELPGPPEGPNVETVRFASATRGSKGLLTVDRAAGGQLISACQRTLKQWGGVDAPVPLGVAPPKAFGGSGLVYEFSSSAGAKGLLACTTRPDGRLVSLALVGEDPAAELAMVGAGLTLK